MPLSSLIRMTRQKTFLPQEKFAVELDVSTSTVIRWETGKGKPNLSAMSKLKDFCEAHSISYDEIEAAWLNYDKENSNE